MEIGGKDLIVQTCFRAVEAAVFTRKTVKELWPDVVFEDADHPDLFMYENEAAKAVWDAVGAIEDQDSANMVYGLFRDNEVTLVYDPGTKSETVAKTMALEFMKLKIMADNPVGSMIPYNGINKEDVKDGAVVKTG